MDRQRQAPQPPNPSLALRWPAAAAASTSACRAAPPRRASLAALVLAALALGALGAGCGRRGPANGQDAASMEGAYPTVLMDPELLSADFVMEQEVTMTHARGENAFRAVLQKRGDELLLIGLGPHGGRAFVLTQRGQEVSFESFMPQELPFPPRFMLHDIHRTWFLDAQLGAVDASGTRSVSRSGETITEHVVAGRVTERRFVREDGAPAGEIVVRFGDGMLPGAPLRVAPPDEVTFENGWYGYRARIRTLSWEAL